MIVLGIETATPVCGVALADGDGCIVETRLRGGTRHGERLGRAVDTLLRDAGLSADQVDGVAVSIGPGSYTGLRIGLGFAKGFVWAQNKPLAAVPTMDAMAASVPVLAPSLCVLIRSGKSEAYQGMYRGEEGRWTASQHPSVIDRKDAGRGCPGGGTVFIGDAAALFEEDVRRNAEGARILPREFSVPSGLPVALKGMDMLRTGAASDVDSLVPMYLKRFQGVE
jgi:tRNA threonylcarbamoyladenosine biosynthesis protein TsaB